jgi:hypothetical protein
MSTFRSIPYKWQMSSSTAHAWAYPHSGGGAILERVCSVRHVRCSDYWLVEKEPGRGLFKGMKCDAPSFVRNSSASVICDSCRK